MVQELSGKRISQAGGRPFTSGLKLGLPGAAPYPSEYSVGSRNQDAEPSIPNPEVSRSGPRPEASGVGRPETQKQDLDCEGVAPGVFDFQFSGGHTERTDKYVFPAPAGPHYRLVIDPSPEPHHESAMVNLVLRIIFPVAGERSRLLAVEARETISKLPDDPVGPVRDSQRSGMGYPTQFIRPRVSPPRSPKDHSEDANLNNPNNWYSNELE
jgi:hypothetical protein